jgi:hypothetical protein
MIDRVQHDGANQMAVTETRAGGRVPVGIVPVVIVTALGDIAETPELI